jgi:DNA-binding NarL/FixJ family response regulator
MSHKIRVFLADDHDVVVRGLQDILNEHDDMEIVGTATSGAGLIEKIVQAEPEVILLDVKMPLFNIFEAIDDLKRLAEREGLFGGELPSIILVTSLLDPYLARKAYDDGIAGYLLKEDALSKRLPSAIRMVAANCSAFSEAVQDVLDSPNSTRGQVTFTADQFEILCLMVHGLSSTQIAEVTGRNVNALYMIQHRIRLKLDVETNSQAVTRAIQQRLVPLGRSSKLAGTSAVTGDAEDGPTIN